MPEKAPDRPSEQEKISDGQQQRLQQLKERDRGFDDQIGAIGEGIDALADIAQRQNEEVKKQNAMLEDLQSRMDNVHDHAPRGAEGDRSGTPFPRPRLHS